ncbi:hypothetical protein CSKR_110986, partial [Clonorchis sinensis]
MIADNISKDHDRFRPFLRFIRWAQFPSLRQPYVLLEPKLDGFRQIHSRAYRRVLSNLGSSRTYFTGYHRITSIWLTLNTPLRQPRRTSMSSAISDVFTDGP